MFVCPVHATKGLISCRGQGLLRFDHLKQLLQSHANNADIAVANNFQQVQSLIQECGQHLYLTMHPK